MKAIKYTFLTLITLTVLFVTHSYFTHGYGSMTEAEIAQSKADLRQATKICNAQRQLATAIGDENFSYWNCLQRNQ